MYHFVSGFTAKLAGTEVGVTEPKAAFSACFGAPFMAHKPSVYAKLLGEKMQKHKARCILLNTGWSGGAFGVGKRISIKHTRALLNAALAGQLDKVATETAPDLQPQDAQVLPGRPGRDPESAQHLVRQGGLRRGRDQAARHVPQELRRQGLRRARHQAGDVKVTDVEGFVQFDVEAVRGEFSALDGRELRELWGLALRVDAAGCASSIVRLESGHATRESARVVSLQRESALLFVLMAANGDPLVGAEVRVSGKALDSSGDWLTDLKRERVFSMQLDPLLGTMRHVGGSGAHDWQATSDESGLAHVRGLPSEIPLSVVISGFGFTHEVELTPSKLFLGEDRVVEWRCPASGKVQGRLVAWEGLDLSRFHVALVAAGTRTTPTAFLEENEPLLSQSKARADGTFEFEGVALGQYYCGLVTARHPAGLAPAQRLALTAVAPETAVTLTLDRGAAIDGLVAGVADSRETITLELHRDGVPGGIELRCSSSTGFRFHAEPLPAGTYTIRGRGNMGSVVVPIDANTGNFVTVSVER
jgi:hypothetical protein